jgi:hypothetical protein
VLCAASSRLRARSPADRRAPTATGAIATSNAGLLYWLRRRLVFTDFLMYWCLASLLLWGWASEKLPGIVIEMALPFCLLAAATLGRFLDTTVIGGLLILDDVSPNSKPTDSI